MDDTWVANLPEDPASGLIWRRAACGVPPGRFGHNCNVVGDSLVVFGGINDKAARHSDTWVFARTHGSGSEGRWAWQMLDIPVSPPARGAHAACSTGDGKVVIFGGIGFDGVRLADTWVLDLMIEPAQWHLLSTPVSPCPRSGHTITWIGGKRIILFGGRSAGFEMMNDVWLLDMEGEWPTWMELCPTVLHPGNEFPAPRSGHSATPIFGGRVLVYGGEDARRGRKNDVWVLDPAVTLQSRPSTCAANNNSRRQPDPGAYRLSRKFWKKLKQRGPAPSKRSFHDACAVDSGHAVLIFGGMVDGELVPQAAAGLGFDAQLYMLQLTP